MATLILRFIGTGRHLVVTDKIAAGVADQNDLNLARYFVDPAKTISRFHFHIKETDAGFAIVDLGSTNGTAVNGRSLRPHVPYALRDGDLIELARNDAFRMQVVVTALNIQMAEDPEGTNIVKDDTHAPVPPGEGLFYREEPPGFVLDGLPVPHTHLTRQEQQLLRHLCRQAERVCSYDDLAQAVWQGWVSNNAISRAISKLRRKLDVISPGSGDRYIQTVHGLGYKYGLLADNPDEDHSPPEMTG